ncbi:hypothetical protein SAMN05216298_4219 [Glycomyces sambucus]|uniref:Uncharacterized protein n=1 Tax=Glycomyces sambucus TaxID=380244 RepID=A0A1G9KS19_9ACTN|nr:hypothetical protein SAMN05216298_4219 [Glycomyces sambucus]
MPSPRTSLVCGPATTAACLARSLGGLARAGGCVSSGDYDGLEMRVVVSVASHPARAGERLTRVDHCPVVDDEQITRPPAMYHGDRFRERRLDLGIEARLRDRGRQRPLNCVGLQRRPESQDSPVSRIVDDQRMRGSRRPPFGPVGDVNLRQLGPRLQQRTGSDTTVEEAGCSTAVRRLQTPDREVAQRLRIVQLLRMARQPINRAGGFQQPDSHPAGAHMRSETSGGHGHRFLVGLGADEAIPANVQVHEQFVEIDCSRQHNRLQVHEEKWGCGATAHPVAPRWRKVRARRVRRHEEGWIRPRPASGAAELQERPSNRGG